MIGTRLIISTSVKTRKVNICSIYTLYISVGIGAFVKGLSQIPSSFLFWLCFKSNINLNDYVDLKYIAETIYTVLRCRLFGDEFDLKFWNLAANSISHWKFQKENVRTILVMLMVIWAGPWENLPYGKIAHFQISAEFCIRQLMNSLLVKQCPVQ